MSAGEGGTARTVIAGLLLLAALVLLLPALVLSVLRVLELEAGPAIRLVSFTPLGLPLYAGVLVLLALAGLVGGGVQPARGASYVAVALAVVGLVLHAWWIAPAWVGKPAPPAAGASVVTVMTANLFEGRGSAADVVAAVREQHVDVLVLEEVGNAFVASAEDAGLFDLLPHHIGGPNGYDPVSGTLVASRWDLRTPSPVATFHQSWLVEVDPPDAPAMTVLGVHPLAPTGANAPQGWLDDQRLLLTTIEQARPDVVLGDFNATGDHEPVRRIYAAGWRDVGDLANVGWQPTWPANGLNPLTGPLPPLVRIDHVLVPSTWAGLSTRTVDVAGSDHLGLVARIARR